jgi:DNA polymerase-3 subunit epsilon
MKRIKRWLNIPERLPKALRHTRLVDLPLLVVDFEYSGLDTKSAKFLSAGWVCACGNEIDMSSAEYYLTRADADLAQTPVIHGLTQHCVSQGIHASEMYNKLVPYMHSHVFVVHNALLDMVMLEKLGALIEQPLPQIVAIDTMQLALYQLNKEQGIIPNNAATLGACRERFGFAPAPAHNALSDAQATAELWLAQRHQIDRQNTMTLKDLQRTRAVKVFGEIKC